MADKNASKAKSKLNRFPLSVTSIFVAFLTLLYSKILKHENENCVSLFYAFVAL
jgi:hypothetical protein